MMKIKSSKLYSLINKLYTYYIYLRYIYVGTYMFIYFQNRATSLINVYEKCMFENDFMFQTILITNKKNNNCKYLREFNNPLI